MLATGHELFGDHDGLGVVAGRHRRQERIVLIDTYNDYNRHQGVEPITAMLLNAAQRVRPVLLTAFLTALGVIPMWANVEFDFIRREIVVGGIAGFWFVHLSAELVSGLFFSTALTLIMVPVMITAPAVIKARIRELRDRFQNRRSAGEEMPSGFDGMAVEVPAAQGASAHVVTKDTTLVERNENGVTVVSRRPAAE